MTIHETNKKTRGSSEKENVTYWCSVCLFGFFPMAVSQRPLAGEHQSEHQVPKFVLSMGMLA
jgi:hypothetical protein